MVLMREDREEYVTHSLIMFRMVECVYVDMLIALWIFLPGRPGSPHRWSLAGEEESVYVSAV